MIVENHVRLFFMHLIGIEPTHAAPEATALSTELQVHLHYHTIFFFAWQEEIYQKGTCGILFHCIFAWILI